MIVGAQEEGVRLANQVALEELLGTLDTQGRLGTDVERDLDWLLSNKDDEMEEDEVTPTDPQAVLAAMQPYIERQKREAQRRLDMQRRISGADADMGRGGRPTAPLPHPQPGADIQAWGQAEMMRWLPAPTSTAAVDAADVEVAEISKTMLQEEAQAQARERAAVAAKHAAKKPKEHVRRGGGSRSHGNRSDRSRSHGNRSDRSPSESGTSSRAPMDLGRGGRVNPTAPLPHPRPEVNRHRTPAWGQAELMRWIPASAARRFFAPHQKPEAERHRGADSMSSPLPTPPPSPPAPATPGSASPAPATPGSASQAPVAWWRRRPGSSA